MKILKPKLADTTTIYVIITITRLFRAVITNADFIIIVLASVFYAHMGLMVPI